MPDRDGAGPRPREGHRDPRRHAGRRLALGDDRRPVHRPRVGPDQAPDRRIGETGRPTATSPPPVRLPARRTRPDPSPPYRPTPERRPTARVRRGASPEPRQGCPWPSGGGGSQRAHSTTAKNSLLHTSSASTAIPNNTTTTPPATTTPSATPRTNVHSADAIRDDSPGRSARRRASSSTSAFVGALDGDGPGFTGGRTAAGEGAACGVAVRCARGAAESSSSSARAWRRHSRSLPPGGLGMVERAKLRPLHPPGHWQARGSSCSRTSTAGRPRRRLSSTWSRHSQSLPTPGTETRRKRPRVHPPHWQVAHAHATGSSASTARLPSITGSPLPVPSGPHRAPEKRACTPSCGPDAPRPATTVLPYRPSPARRHTARTGSRRSRRRLPPPRPASAGRPPRRREGDARGRPATEDACLAATGNAPDGRNAATGRPPGPGGRGRPGRERRGNGRRRARGKAPVPRTNAPSRAAPGTESDRPRRRRGCAPRAFKSDSGLRGASPCPSSPRKPSRSYP